MKKTILPIVALFIIMSCNDSKEEPVTSTAAVKTGTKKQVPEFDIPIKHKDWEIGDPDNVRTALGFYKYWDEKKYDKVHELCADSVKVRVPGTSNENVIVNDNIDKAFAENRDQYGATNNEIVSAISLHDKESGQDWVAVVTYNKWIEKNGKKDSAIYSDYWQLKNGKLYMLMSFEKRPTSQFLKDYETKK